MPNNLTSLCYPAAYGCNATDEPVMLDPRLAGRFVQLAGNMRIENNRWRTNFRTRELQGAGDGYESWRTKHTQGAIWYLPRAGQGSTYLGKGNARIIESAAGRLFTLEPKNDTFEVLDVSGGNVAYANLRLAWLCQGENYVIRTDGVSQTQIYDGTNPVYYSSGYNRYAKTASRFPNGAGPTVYAGGRFWTVLFGRRIYASNSLHQIDQVSAVDLLSFTDQTYDYINVYFSPPGEDGDIAALCASINSGFQDSRAQGEVLAMCSGPTVWGVQLGVPRTQWPTTNMRRSRSKETAATGPCAFYVRDGDILMRTTKGIESMNLLARERSTLGNPTIDLGADLIDILGRDDEASLLFASMVNPAKWNRMLCTVAPQIVGARHFHLGWVTANWNPLNQRVPAGLAWEGLQTLPAQMGRVIQFLEARIDGKTRLMALLDKDDGIDKGLAEMTLEEGGDVLADGTVVPKQWFIQTKKLTPGGVFRTAGYGCFLLYLENAMTDVLVEIFIRSSNNQQFKLVRTVEMQVEVMPDDVFGCAKKGEKLISLGKLAVEFKEATWIQILMKGVGVVTVDLALKADEPDAPDEKPDKECVVATSDYLCDHDPYYSAMP